jgi:membrane fusion protein (multidrug efflux system)
MNRGSGPRAVLLALVACVGVSGCGRKEAAKPIVASPVMVTRVEGHHIEDRIEATGQLIAPSQASIAAQVAGQVTKVARDEGAAVQAGDLVIEIDPERRELEAQSARALLAQAEAQAAEAERNLARIEQLHAKGVAADAKLDETRTALRSAKASRDAAAAQLGMAQRSLADSSVRAPFAGLVARRWVSPGEYVAPGQKLFDLVALDPIEVELHLPERDSSRVAIGAPLAVRVTPFPDEVFTARVTVVSPTIDPATRTLRVKGSLPNPDGRLRPGLFARADLGVDVRDHVPMIPEEAVLQRADGPVAFRLVDERHVQRRVLELGVFREGLVEVRDGLAVGDVIVQRGQSDLVDGSVVTVRNADGSAVSGAPGGQVGSGPVAAPPVRAASAAEETQKP